MVKYLTVICKSIEYVYNPIYYIWSKPQTQTLDDRRKEDDKNQPSKMSIDEVVQNGDMSHPGQRHVEHVAKEQNDTSDIKTNAISNPDKTEKHISYLYKKKENTVDAIQPKLFSSFHKYCLSPHVKLNKSVSLKEKRLKNRKNYNIGSWGSIFAFSLCFILLDLWCKVYGNKNAKTYKKREESVDGIQSKLFSNFCKFCSSPQVKFDKCVCSKETRLTNNHSNFIGSWSSMIPLRLCFILLVLFCTVSGNQNVKMYLSVHHTQAIFDEPFTLLCHIKNATECTHLTFLQGKFENNNMHWKILAKGDKPYTQQVESSVYPSKNGITYNLTLSQLKPADVGARFRCECDEHNNVSKSLIQIDDRLTVNPEKVISKFKILNMAINITTNIWNVYPEPGNCTLTILSDNHSLVVSYNRTESTTTKFPNLLNTSYSGFSSTPFKLCYPTVTVMCQFGDAFISEHYTSAVCDDLEKKSEEITFPIIYITITLCAVLLFVFSVVAAICVKRIWKKRRKHIEEIIEVTMGFLD